MKRGIKRRRAGTKIKITIMIKSEAAAGAPRKSLKDRGAASVTLSLKTILARRIRALFEFEPFLWMFCPV
jgi:hypothetical protein